MQLSNLPFVMNKDRGKYIIRLQKWLNVLKHLPFSTTCTFFLSQIYEIVAIWYFKGYFCHLYDKIHNGQVQLKKVISSLENGLLLKAESPNNGTHYPVLTACSWMQGRTTLFANLFLFRDVGIPWNHHSHQFVVKHNFLPNLHY